METVGVIAEYNPFHNGHLLQLREIRRRFPRANIIVAMSGSFTQRGTVAILDKWRRAEAAVRHGVSLVLELPAVFSTRSAQYFASGGVRLFDRLGVVDYLAFGSECDSLTQLQSMSKKVEAAVESSRADAVMPVLAFIKVRPDLFRGFPARA
jgi:predicted nucleotidyltransferase